jgi:tight adherence protein B
MSIVISALTAVIAITLVGSKVRPRPARTPVGHPPRRLLLGDHSLPWRRRRGPSDVDVALWCQRVARSSRSGRSLSQAIADADAETPSDLRPFPDVGLGLRRGRALADALSIGQPDPSTAVGVAGPVLLACAEIGGPPASPLERVADILMLRAAERDERRAATAQARLSARVLTAVPFGVLAFLALSEPTIRTALASPAGQACLAGGVALNVLGRCWMSALIRRSS